MNHPVMVALATHLAAAGIATLRFQFPYMDRGGKRPDAPALCRATVRATVAKAYDLAPSLPLFAGGKSFGGRMTSQSQADQPLPHVRGLVFFGFPLHPAGRPSTARADHLFQVKIPMLFIQGSRDRLADLTLLEPLCHELGTRATLEVIEHADHSFHVPVRSGRTDAETEIQITGRVATWVGQVIARG